MSMKIYKYTSLNSAIAILRSNGVALSNPKDFNDPNDCAFIQDDYEKEKINKLLIDYFVFVSLSQLVSNGKITLKKSDRLIFNTINKEFSLYKAILKKNPYFDLKDIRVTIRPRWRYKIAIDDYFFDWGI